MWRRKAEKMVGEKVDLTDFLVGEALSVIGIIPDHFSLNT